MPEGPELCMNSRFVNNVCNGRLFAGKVFKSAVSKCAEVDFISNAYTISSEARGKEMALTLQCTVEPVNRLRLLFRFGMSGKFRFSSRSEIPKHAHLKFFTDSEGVLSFVDVRRFGSWHVMPEGWGENRGPDPMFEYHAFRSNVLQNLEDSAFNRPICEALLNQKYFNGIGNYLRAEILFRVGVAPFMCARKVLEPMCKVKDSEEEDLLWYCHKLPQEVVDLKQNGMSFGPHNCPAYGGVLKRLESCIEGHTHLHYFSLGKSEVAAVTEEDHVAFCKWLKCYENPNMNTARDNNGRTIWYKGEAGAMCPKSRKTKKLRKNRRHVPEDTVDKSESLTQDEVTHLEDERVEITMKSSEDVKNGSAVMKTEDIDALEGTPRKRRKNLPEKGMQSSKRIKTETEELTDKGKKTRTRGRKQSTPLPTRRSSRIKAYT